MQACAAGLTWRGLEACPGEGSISDRAHLLADRRVLVVEDEYLIATEVERWLQAAGSKVLGPVPSADWALDLIENGDLDAAVLDINLGNDVTVYPVAGRLGSLGIPYLLATGDVRVTGMPSEVARPRPEKPFVETELVRA